MAGDWIKFRKSLRTDGRVRKMSATLRTSVCEVLGALSVFWSLADENADENGELSGWSIEEMDKEIGIIGFCAALPECWIDLGCEWVKCPDFLEHNGSTAKRRAEDSKRKRAVRNLSAKCPKNVQKNRPSSSLLFSSLNSNKRKEKSEPENPADFIPASLQTPEFVQAFADWMQHKRERGETYRPTGLAALLKKLDALGPDAAAAAISNSIASNYAGIYPAPSAKPTGGGGGGQPFKTAHERKLEREAAAIAEFETRTENRKHGTERTNAAGKTTLRPMAQRRTNPRAPGSPGPGLAGDIVRGITGGAVGAAVKAANIPTDTGRPPRISECETACGSNEAGGTSRDARGPQAAGPLGASESEDRTLKAKEK